MRKKLLSVFMTAGLMMGAFSMAACGNSAASTSSESSAKSASASEESSTESSSVSEESNAESSSEEETGELLTGTHHAEISVKDYGTIYVELDADTAPISVTNFVDLANEGFYDGLTFHRIIDGFMIQGGDPNADGTGGSDKTIKGEFSENGVENDLSHTRGAISMARANDYDSASSQFFIVQSDSTYLDGQYACFGYVTEGMEIVDQICEDVEEGQNGAVEKENQPVIESIKITD